MRRKSEETLTEFKTSLNEMFIPIKGLRIGNEEVEEVRCIRGSDGTMFQ